MGESDCLGSSFFVKDIGMCMGTYIFNRTIDDRYANTRHVASGTLHITPTTWQENGVLHSLNDSPFYQNYDLEFIDNGLCVSYANGGVFYHLPQIDGIHHITHNCGDDMYRGIWTYINKTLDLTWEVKGPRKEYTMCSTYILKA